MTGTLDLLTFAVTSKWIFEWAFGALLFLGFWNKKLGILGAIGSCFSFIATITIIPFMPNAWAASAGGFPCHDRHRCFPDGSAQSHGRTTSHGSHIARPLED